MAEVSGRFVFKGMAILLDHEEGRRNRVHNNPR
jgi:hypothetical protein